MVVLSENAWDIGIFSKRVTEKNLEQSVERGLQAEALLDDGNQDVNETAIHICVLTALSDVP
jgi:hypothetical protein